MKLRWVERVHRFKWAALVAVLLSPALAQDPTLDSCRAHRRYGRLADEQRCYLRLTGSPDPYVRAEAYWGLGRYREANDAFREAVAAQPKNPDYRVRWGRLFLDRMQPKDAQDLFLEALEIKDPHAGAILGLALIAAEDYEGRAAALARKALEADPKLVEAYVLLATLALQENNDRAAMEYVQQALRVDPECLEAMAIAATLDLLRDRPDSAFLAKILAINPVYGEAYATAARFFALNRRYEEAIELYRKALALNPRLHKARAELGLNLLRLGHEREAREQLEACWEAGERYPAVGNPLRLLDSSKNFRYYRSSDLVLKLHQKEYEILLPYVEQEARRAIQALEKRYQMRLDRPVQIELYPDHEDFAVRTLGMPGMAGALGVAFGYTVAMDSPSSKRPGEIHWASTLWHELSHVFTLSATRNRIPRWFTEGLAVYEETATHPEWGDRLSPAVILGLRDKKLLPIAELERGFLHPESPEQVLLSYYQAGKVCQFIEKRWGFGKVLEMLRAFREPKSTSEVLQQVLGVKPEEFDKEFGAWVYSSTQAVVENFDRWKKGMAAVGELVRTQKHEEIVRHAPAVRDLYPDYVESGNLYEVLAESYLALGDERAACEELMRYYRAGGKNPTALKKLASLLEGQGRRQEAIRVLESLNWIYPADEELHARLGDLLMVEGETEKAIREYQVLVAMKPLDRAGAHYRLAKAFHAAGRKAEASEQVLLALEAAPGYRPAQRLLLEIHATSQGQKGGN